MISDSIAKYIDAVDGLTVQSYRGATIADIESFVKQDNLNLWSYDCIILHAGTNDIHRRSVKEILQAYKFLFRACSNIAPRVHLAVSLKKKPHSKVPRKIKQYNLLHNLLQLESEEEETVQKKTKPASGMKKIQRLRNLPKRRRQKRNRT